MKHLRSALPMLLCVAIAAHSAGQTTTLPEPDPRYKADILLVVGHPDDDIEVASYLARVIEQEHKRVAVVYMTHGNSGGNAVGLEQARVLKQVREIEARKAVGSYGIENVWLLPGSDTPGADVLHSLEAWGHGDALEQVVRIMRLTRPEVVLTWLPDYVVGENHEDHQGASVLANEAFDLAADQLAFPEQLEAPRNRTSINNYGEGLRPWQPKKIYFFSDATHLEFAKGKGPEYSSNAVSPSRGISYAAVAAASWRYYKTQDDFTEPALKAFTETPVQLIFGKSLVPATVTGDVFEGITDRPIAYAKPRGYTGPATEAQLELGGPWAFYRAFWPAHGLAALADLFPPQAQVAPGETLWVPLVLRNDSDQPRRFAVHATLPAGWAEKPELTTLTVPAHDAWPVQLTLTPPAGLAKGSWQTLQWQAEGDGASLGSVKLQVTVEANGLPQ